MRRLAVAAALCGCALAQVDPLPPSCKGTLTGVFTDSTKRVLSVVAPCGGAPNPNPKACAACTPDGKDWALTDSAVSCPTKAGSCPPCDNTKVTPLYCQQMCTQMGQFRYSGVEAGNQCFCGDEISPKTPSPGGAKDNKAPCSGDKTQMCGGNNVIAIYEVACEHAPAGAADSTASEGSGFGSTFSVVVLCLAAFYAAGGTAYNQRTTGGSWRESLPHVFFWTELHGLVKDGIAFSRAKQAEFSDPENPKGWQDESFSTEKAGGDDGEDYVSRLAGSPSSSDSNGDNGWEGGRKSRGSTDSGGSGSSPEVKKKRKKKRGSTGGGGGGSGEKSRRKRGSGAASKSPLSQSLLPAHDGGLE